MPKKIVIADDERPLRKALALKLTHDGFEVTEAADGNEALSSLKDGTVDLLLLDIMMPGLDGFGVLEQLRKNNSKIPVMVTSNLSQEEDKKKSLDLGAVEYIVKSNHSLDEIITIIGKYV